MPTTGSFELQIIIRAHTMLICSHNIVLFTQNALCKKNTNFMPQKILICVHTTVFWGHKLVVGTESTKIWTFGHKILISCGKKY